jgi:hypothetical protein
MQRKLSVFVHDGMTCIGPALIADDNVSLLRKRIYDLSFSFISPVRNYYCLYHANLLTELWFI